MKTIKENGIRVIFDDDNLRLTIMSDVFAKVECLNGNRLVYMCLVSEWSHNIIPFNIPINITDIKCYGVFKNGKQKKIPISVYKK